MQAELPGKMPSGLLRLTKLQTVKLIFLCLAGLSGVVFLVGAIVPLWIWIPALFLLAVSAVVACVCTALQSSPPPVKGPWILPITCQGLSGLPSRMKEFSTAEKLGDDALLFKWKKFNGESCLLAAEIGGEDFSEGSLQKRLLDLRKAGGADHHSSAIQLRQGNCLQIDLLFLTSALPERKKQEFQTVFALNAVRAQPTGDSTRSILAVADPAAEKLYLRQCWTGKGARIRDCKKAVRLLREVLG